MSKLRESIKKIFEDNSFEFDTRDGSFTIYTSDQKELEELYDIVKNILTTNDCEIIDDESWVDTPENTVKNHHGPTPFESNAGITYEYQGNSYFIGFFSYYFNEDEIDRLSRYNDYMFKDDYWFNPGVYIESPSQDISSEIIQVVETYSYEWSGSI